MNFNRHFTWCILFTNVFDLDMGKAQAPRSCPHSRVFVDNKSRGLLWPSAVDAALACDTVNENANAAGHLPQGMYTPSFYAQALD
jgi:hypothetical protein